MNRNETHPGKHQVDNIELLLAVALEVAEALLVLTVALVALALTASRRPGPWDRKPAVTAPPATTDAPPPRTPHLGDGTGQSENVPSRSRPLLPVAAISDAPPVPLLHPLAVVAEQLEALPVTRLRPLAGVTSKRARKAELVAALVAC